MVFFFPWSTDTTTIDIYAIFDSNQPKKQQQLWWMVTVYTVYHYSVDYRLWCVSDGGESRVALRRGVFISGLSLSARVPCFHHWSLWFYYFNLFCDSTKH